MNASSQTLPASANGRLDNTEGLRPSAHREIEQRDDEDQRERNNVAEAGLHLGEEFILAGPLQSVPRRQGELRRDNGLRIIDPAAEVALGLVDVGEHIPDEDAVLVL